MAASTRSLASRSPCPNSSRTLSSPHVSSRSKPFSCLGSFGGGNEAVLNLVWSCCAWRREYHKAARGQDEDSQEGDKDEEGKGEGESDQGKASKGNSQATSGTLQRGVSSVAPASAPPQAVNDDDLYDF